MARMSRRKSRSRSRSRSRKGGGLFYDTPEEKIIKLLKNGTNKDYDEIKKLIVKMDLRQLEKLYKNLNEKGYTQFNDYIKEFFESNVYYQDDEDNGRY